MKKRVIVLGVLFLLAFLFILILVNVSAKTPELTFIQATDTHIVYNSSASPYLFDGRTDACDAISILTDGYDTYCSQGWSIAPQLALNSTVDLINSQYPTANFTIFTGDLIAQEDFDDYKIEAMNIFKSIIDRLTTDFYYVGASHHDQVYTESSADMYESNLSQTLNYNFTIGDNLFIITSEVVDQIHYNYTFLNNTINAYNDGTYSLFVFGHEAPVAGDRTHVQEEATDILEANKNNFKSIVWTGGHNHANRLYVKEGIPYFTTIATMLAGGQLRSFEIFDDHIRVSLSDIVDEGVSNFSKAYKEDIYGTGILGRNQPYQIYYEDEINPLYNLSTGLGDEVYYIPTRFIDTCQNLTEFEGYYALNQSIDASGIARCIDIQNDSITLDLNDFSIDGDTSVSDTIINADGVNNLTIKNGNITGGKAFAFGTSGVIINNITNLNLEDLNLLAIQKLSLQYVENARVVNVLLNDSQAAGIAGVGFYTTDLKDVSFENFNISNGASRGMRLYSVLRDLENITMKGFNLINNTGTGFEFKNNYGSVDAFNLTLVDSSLDGTLEIVSPYNIVLKSSLDAQVNTSSDIMIKNANLTIISSTGEIVSSQLSDYRGYYDEIYLLKAVIDSSEVYTYTDNYSITLNDSNLIYIGIEDSVNLTLEGEGIFKTYTFDTLDDTIPNVSILTPLNDSSTNETSIDFIFNVTDANSNVDSCFVNFNGTLYYNTSAIVYSGNNTINVSNLSLGSYGWYAYCNDTAGNEANSSNKSFTIVSDEDYCTDVDGGFYYSSQCYADQTAACAASGQVVSGNGCADASSSSAPSNNLGTEGDYTGKTNKITYGVRHNFEYSSESHHTYLRKINRGTREVTIEVNSEKQLITIKEGGNVSVDLTGDGVADVVFVLEKIYDDSIAIDLRVEDIVAGELVVGEVITDNSVDSVKESDKTWVGFALVLVIILGIFGVIFWFKKKR